MVRNTLGKQWANIVRLFEQAERLQRKHNASVVAAGGDVDDYNTGRLRILELGVTSAKDCYRAYRFRFWLKPTISENQILMNLLLALQTLTVSEEFDNKSYRAAMTNELDNWISRLAGEDVEAAAVLHRPWIRGSAD